MPRLARLDAPGVQHHVIIRGIDRRKIFRDRKDRKDFVERLGLRWREGITLEGSLFIGVPKAPFIVTLPAYQEEATS